MGQLQNFRNKLERIFKLILKGSSGNLN